MTASARQEIHQLQEALFRKQRRLISTSVSGMTAAFRRYEARALARVRTFEREATYGEILHAASTADLVYVGDYHTLKQSQRQFLKLIQRRHAHRPLVLALEFVQGRHQGALDAWLERRIGEAGFLDRIELRKHQIFDTWPHFKPVLEEARARRIPIVALDLLGNARTTLAQRDAYAALRIARACAQHPTAQVFVLAGQLHVAPPHLPASVAGHLRERGLLRTSASIYQNCERIWFELQRRHRELEVEAVKVRDGEWCLLNTPPVVVQQSYLDWLEGGDEPLESAHLEERFRSLARLVARALDLSGPNVEEALAEVEVWTAGDLSFLKRLPARGFSREEIRQIERQILERESYYIPRANLAYLANLSVNHAAEEATHFLRHVVSGAGAEARPLVDAFYSRALEEAYAFCGSKIVNPRRKCAHVADFERLRGPGMDPFTRDVARLVLRHLAIESGHARPTSLSQLYRSTGPELFNAVTHALGYMLGDRLHHALLSGEVSRTEVRDLFLDPLGDEGAPLLVYMDLAARLRDVPLPSRS